MPDLSGNPHAAWITDGPGSDGCTRDSQAILAVAWELRTANLIAVRDHPAEDPDIKARLGIADDPATSPY
jgi:hypothetical protein